MEALHDLVRAGKVRYLGASSMWAWQSAPIVGVTKPQHLADAVAALDVELTEDEVELLESPYVVREPTYF